MLDDELPVVPIYAITYPSPGVHTYGGRQIQDIGFVKRESHSDAWVTANKLPRPAEVTLVGWKRRD